MRITGVQNDSATFGTKVFMRADAKKMVRKSKAKNAFFDQVKQLKNNGKDDILILSYSQKKAEGGKTGIINADLIVQKGKKYYVNPFSDADILAEKLPDGKYKFIDLLKLYETTQEDMIPTDFTKLCCEKLLTGFKEI